MAVNSAKKSVDAIAGAFNASVNTTSTPIVIPLSKPDKILANERNKGSSGEPVINQTVNVYTELDMNVVNRRLAWELYRA